MNKKILVILSIITAFSLSGCAPLKTDAWFKKFNEETALKDQKLVNAINSIKLDTNVLVNQNFASSKAILLFHDPFYA